MKSKAMVSTIAAGAPTRLWQLLLLFALGVVLLYLRNPDTLINPVIYAEDGTWTALALREGWWSAFVHSRTDYFVFFNTLVLLLGSGLSELVTGNSLAWLPQAIAFFAFSFLSVLATLTFLTVRNVSSALLGTMAFLGVLLLPMGGTQNEILGRSLQLGFYMPLLAIQLLYWRSQRPGLAVLLALDVLLVLCVATNPVVLALCFGYMALDFLRDRRLLPAMQRNFSLLIPLLIFTCFLLPRMGGKGGVTAEFVATNLIEALIGRSLLYPLIFPWYSGLSNLLAVGLFLLLLVFVITAYVRARTPAARTLILLLSFALVTYTVATIAMRPGLTSFLSNYRITFPDRYFMGINLLMLVLFVVSAGQYLAQQGWMRRLGMGLLTALTLVYACSPGSIFEWSASKLPIRKEFTFAEQLCLSTPIPGTDNVQVQVYPLPNWKMVVPAQRVDKADCPASLDASAGYVATVSGEPVQVNHLAPTQDHEYRVNGVDPYVVFKLSSPVEAADISRLTFDFYCQSPQPADQVLAQLFWRTQDEGFSAARNIVFAARQGKNFIDVSRFREWASPAALTQVRFDLIKPGDCEVIRIDELALGSSHLVPGK